MAAERMNAGVGLPGWRVIAGSVPGPNHANVGLPNQDSVRQVKLPGGLHLLAVADGAGSARQAELGSRFAVQAAAEAAERCFGAVPGTLARWQSATREFADDCLRGFDQAVSRAGGARADFSTTLLAAVLGPPYVGYVCVGDGFLVLHRTPGGSALVVAPPHVRDNAGETVFLTSPGRDRDLRRNVIVDTAISGLALCTDGVIDGMLDVDRAPDGAVHHVAPPEFDAYFDLFRSPAVDAGELNRKLLSREFAASSGDDKTMLMAVRR